MNKAKRKSKPDTKNEDTKSEPERKNEKEKWVSLVYREPGSNEVWCEIVRLVPGDRYEPICTFERLDAEVIAKIAAVPELLDACERARTELASIAHDAPKDLAKRINAVHLFLVKAAKRTHEVEPYRGALGKRL